MVPCVPFQGCLPGSRLCPPTSVLLRPVSALPGWRWADSSWAERAPRCALAPRMLQSAAVGMCAPAASRSRALDPGPGWPSTDQPCDLTPALPLDLSFPFGKQRGRRQDRPPGRFLLVSLEVVSSATSGALLTMGSASKWRDSSCSRVSGDFVQKKQETGKIAHPACHPTPWPPPVSGPPLPAPKE